jgi:hypothetical protein
MASSDELISLLEEKEHLEMETAEPTMEEPIKQADLNPQLQKIVNIFDGIREEEVESCPNHEPWTEKDEEELREVLDNKAEKTYRLHIRTWTADEEEKLQQILQNKRERIQVETAKEQVARAQKEYEQHLELFNGEIAKFATFSDAAKLSPNQPKKVTKSFLACKEFTLGSYMENCMCANCGPLRLEHFYIRKRAMCHFLRDMYPIYEKQLEVLKQIVEKIIPRTDTQVWEAITRNTTPMHTLPKTMDSMLELLSKSPTGKTVEAYNYLLNEVDSISSFLKVLCELH